MTCLSLGYDTYVDSCNCSSLIIYVTIADGVVSVDLVNIKRIILTGLYDSCSIQSCFLFSLHNNTVRCG